MTTGGAERRQLTVMFCDLVGSTALSSRLDPEELRDVLRAYQHTCAEVIARFDGHVAQYLGDGLLVYFGYPQAHEDDAQRAVRASLGIVDAVGRLAAPARDQGETRLAVRIGIHTGPVVVGELGGGGRHEQLALGETPNLAARLQALAEPDRVLISLATHRLVDGFFLIRDLGPQTLKGVAASVPVFEVTGETAARSRLDVAVSAGLTPLVGREQEIGLLLDRWGQASEGHGQVVLLMGEPGVGKSRLLQVVKARSEDVPHRRLECRGSPYYAHTPLHPVTDLLPRLFDWSREDAPETKFAKLERGLVTAAATSGDAVPLLASLLSLPASDRHPQPSLSPERQKQKTLEALLGLLLAMAAAEPVLLIVEDLHWVDPTTLEWLTLLLDQVPTARLLVLLTARPSFASPWPARSHLTPMTLARFARKQTEAMVNRVTGGKALPAEVLQQIVAKTDGVPLFVEELTKMVLESGLLRDAEDRWELTGPLSPLAIPTTLQDSLMARLDRLAQVKEVAQLGAALGRTFSHELIRAVGLQDDRTLEHALARLVEAELLYQRGVPPAATYTFKHALVQDTAYQSLLKRTRQHYHRRIAEVLATQFRDAADTEPEVLAHHYAEAGDHGRAIVFWQQAGERASRRSANIEAIAHLTNGLALVRKLPPHPDRDRSELRLQIGLGAALQATRGFAAPEVETAYRRARELAAQDADAPELFPLLRGLSNFYLVRADFRTASELGAHLLDLADRTGDSGLRAEARARWGWCQFFQGALREARATLERGIGLYDPERHRSMAFQYGQDPGVLCRSYLALTLWVLGYPDQALRRSREAVALARELSHPFTLADALFLTAWLHQLRREPAEVDAVAREVVGLAHDHGFPFWAALAISVGGSAAVAQGRQDEGTDQMRAGLAGLAGAGALLLRPYLLALLSDACMTAERIAEGDTTLTEAVDLLERTGERVWRSELQRLRGRLFLALPQPGEGQADISLRAAIMAAREQHAKSFELRATVELGLLLRRQGRSAEARRMLSEMYGWFTEGFDTPDLTDARALLDALSS